VFEHAGLPSWHADRQRITVSGPEFDDDRTEFGNVIVDAQQRTSVECLYAAGDIVSDLHQLAVATGHAAIAATTIHNSLGRNPR
jgi:thioredoxin reductase (NADPH)